MRISRIVILLAAVFAGLYFVPWLLTVAPLERERYDQYVTQRLPQIKQALNEKLAWRDGACLYGDPYSLGGGKKLTGPFGSVDDPDLYRPPCNRCEDLHEAGLLEKSVIEIKRIPPLMSEFSTRYELTALGKSVYSEELQPHRFEKDVFFLQWKFCFGKTVLHEIEEALPPFGAGGDVAVGVKYVAAVVDPHPFLFDPKSKPLRLTVPKPGNPALYPPRITTVMFHSDGTIELDDSYRYGKYISESRVIEQ